MRSVFDLAMNCRSWPSICRTLHQWMIPIPLYTTKITMEINPLPTFIKAVLRRFGGCLDGPLRAVNQMRRWCCANVLDGRKVVSCFHRLYSGRERWKNLVFAKLSFFSRLLPREFSTCRVVESSCARDRGYKSERVSKEVSSFFIHEQRQTQWFYIIAYTLKYTMIIKCIKHIPKTLTVSLIWRDLAKRRQLESIA